MCASVMILVLIGSEGLIMCLSLLSASNILMSRY
jgi:hypothetical protein